MGPIVKYSPIILLYISDKLAINRLALVLITGLLHGDLACDSTL